MAHGELTGIHHVSLSVSDLDRSAGWYEDLFDLTLLFEEQGEGRRAKVYRIGRSASMLGLVEHAGSDRDPFRPDRTGLDHVAFTVDTLDDVEVWASRLDVAGVAHSGVIEIPPGAILNVRDPDDIQLSIFWDRG